MTVESVDTNGALRLRDGRTLDPTYREFLPGYAVSSYGSQGKTVDHVLFSDSGIRAATHDQQWYVTISRARRGIRIFTTDADQLRDNILRSGNRRLALDLAPPSSRKPVPRWIRPWARPFRTLNHAVVHLIAWTRYWHEFQKHHRTHEHTHHQRRLGN